MFLFSHTFAFISLILAINAQQQNNKMRFYSASKRALKDFHTGHHHPNKKTKVLNISDYADL